MKTKVKAPVVIDPAIAKAQEALKVRMAEVRPIAQAIAESIFVEVDAAESRWSYVRDAKLSGFTFEELEAVALVGVDGKEIIVPGRGGKDRAMNLKDLPAYRKAKQFIVALAEKNIALQPDMSSHEVQQLTKKAKAASAGGTAEADESTTDSTDTAKVKYQTVADMFADAFSTLKADASFRKMFAPEIQEVARMLSADITAETAELLKKVA